MNCASIKLPFLNSDLDYKNKKWNLMHNIMQQWYDIIYAVLSLL